MSIQQSQQRPLKAPPSLHTEDDQGSRRVHVLGLGNIGMLFAHGIATPPNPPPITLLFHRKELLEIWNAAGKKITITKDGCATASSGYDVEVIGAGESRINNLIVATKASNTLEPLKSIAHRLDSTSTVLFAQNGMGVIPFVRQNLPGFNSTCYAAIITHGLNRTEDFRTNFAGVDKILLGKSPVTLPTNSKVIDAQSPGKRNSASETPWLITQILSSPLLAASLLDPVTLQDKQLEKLMTNAVINPLTALLRISNGMLLDERYPFLRRLMQRLAAEMIAILEHEDAQASFSQHHELGDVLNTIRTVARATAKNQSSMLQDMLAGRETEIDWINGWFVKEGQRLSLKTPLNSKLVALVKEKKQLPLDEESLMVVLGDEYI